MTRVQDIYPADRVILREVGLRDGLQLVKTFPSTAAKQRWVRDEYGAGVRHFEVGSFLPAKTFPQFVDVRDVIATMSTPASNNFSVNRSASFGSTGPTIEQPSAIEIAALTIGLCELASRNSHRRLTLATAESRERLALAWLCSSVADTTVASSATPEASASLTPRSLSASAMP